jgi:STE24 endopeptidase
VPEQTAEGRLLTSEDIDRDRQEEAKSFARLRHRLMAAELALGGLFTVALIVSGLAQGLKGVVLASTGRPMLLVAGYFFILTVTYSVLTFPLEYYGGFRLPHRYGLSNQTLREWLVDEAKSGLLGLALGLIVVEVIYFLLGALPGWWWLVTAALMLVFGVIMANLAPVVLVPIFYKLKPLEEEALEARLKRLAERARTTVRGVYTIDLSSKTKAANAMVMGLGNTRRIVLGDTLYEHYQPDEIETILAHELGHQSGHDLWWGLLLQSLLSVGGLYVANLALRWGVQVLGYSGVDDVASMPLLALVMGTFLAVTTPLVNAFSRWRERMADDHALRITEKPRAFVSAMVRLANQNLADVDPEPWVEFLLYSHPAVGKRIRRGEKAAEKKQAQEVKS